MKAYRIRHGVELKALAESNRAETSDNREEEIRPKSHCHPELARRCPVNKHSIRMSSYTIGTST
jgi:hypothetical protein